MDHLARAKQFIAIAESSDSKLAAYKKAADEIVRARKADHRLTWSVVAQQIGRDESYAQKLVRWRTKGGVHAPFGEAAGQVAERHARAVLKDPARFEQVIPDLPTKALQELADRADEAIADRRESRQAEHNSGVTGKHVSDFQPDEYWMDSIIIRLNRNAREAASLFQRGGGLLGAMTTEEAFEYLSESERLVSEVRVAFQTRVRDEVRV